MLQPQDSFIRKRATAFALLFMIGKLADKMCGNNLRIKDIESVVIFLVSKNMSF